MPGPLYVRLTYKDGSRSLVKMTRRDFRSADLLAHLPMRPAVEELTRGEARQAFQTEPLDVTESSISEEFSR
jgi:hypothetical protein